MNDNIKIIRKKGTSTDYKYELWVNGEFIHARKTDRMYNSGAVYYGGKWRGSKKTEGWYIDMMRRDSNQYPKEVYHTAAYKIIKVEDES